MPARRRVSPADSRTYRSKVDIKAERPSKPELPVRVQLPRVKAEGNEAREPMSNPAELPLLVPLPVKRGVGDKKARVLMGNPVVLPAAGLRPNLGVVRANRKAERKRVERPLRLPALDNTNLI